MAGKRMTHRRRTGTRTRRGGMGIRPLPPRSFSSIVAHHGAHGGKRRTRKHRGGRGFSFGTGTSGNTFRRIFGR